VFRLAFHDRFSNMSLNMNNLPTAILLFGVAGVGKSHLGALVAKKLGFFHYELDDDLTDEMKLAINEGREFTDPMRDRFFTVAAERIREVLAQHPKTIFTQGAYKERHREFLRSMLPGLECIWVVAPGRLITRRLGERGTQVGEEYARRILRNFELPLGGRVFLNNDASEEELISRFLGLF
jgi:gluconokinase